MTNPSLDESSPPTPPAGTLPPEKPWLEESRPDADQSSARRDTGDEADEKERNDRSMPLLEHLRELRSRLLRCLIGMVAGFLICYGFVDVLYAEIIRPLTSAMPPNSHMIFTVLYGPFFVQLKIALLAGLLLSSPYIFYQIWAFNSPGLYVE